MIHGKVKQEVWTTEMYINPREAKRKKEITH